MESKKETEKEREYESDESFGEKKKSLSLCLTFNFNSTLIRNISAVVVRCSLLVVGKLKIDPS